MIVVHGYADSGRGGYWSTLILWSTVTWIRAAGVLVLAYRVPRQFFFASTKQHCSGELGKGSEMLTFAAFRGSLMFFGANV